MSITSMMLMRVVLDNPIFAGRVVDDSESDRIAVYCVLRVRANRRVQSGTRKYWYRRPDSLSDAIVHLNWSDSGWRKLPSNGTSISYQNYVDVCVSSKAESQITVVNNSQLRQTMMA